jgi:hypothetical protein
MVQRILIFLVAAMVAYACASTKKSAIDVSVGTWDYVVKNTPEGDLSGIFVIAKTGDTYTGYLEGAQGRTDLRDVTVENDQLKCNFDFSGYTIMMTGTFAGDNFDGKVSVEYNDFPLTATKRP